MLWAQMCRKRKHFYFCIRATHSEQKINNGGEIYPQVQIYTTSKTVAHRLNFTQHLLNNSLFTEVCLDVSFLQLVLTFD